MRKFVLAALLMAAVPTAASAAPCVPASLAGYIALAGAGCTIGDVTVADFSSAPAPGASEIDPISIFVTPLDGSPATVGLSFQLIGAAASGQVRGNGIGYSIGGAALAARDLILSGSTVVPDGVITAVQFAQDPLIDPDPLTDPNPLIVFDIGSDAELFASAALSPASFFDIFTEITLDGGLAGSAGLDIEVTQNFRIPEPAILGLLGVGLGMIAWRRRARRSVS